MTLIVGLKTANTVVLAAETEEAVGITAKRNVFKLSRIEGRGWVVVVGGAGDSATVENATRRIGWGLEKCSNLTERKLGDVIDDVLATVHTKYIDPDRHSEGIALVVGAVSGGELYLLSTDKRTYQFHDDYAYAGLGTDLAVYFLDRLYGHEFDWEDAAKVAGFVLVQVKQSSQACGGDSQIYVLQTTLPRWRSLGSWAVLEIDNHCRDVENSISNGILTKLRSYKLHRNEHLDDYEEESPPRQSSRNSKRTK